MKEISKSHTHGGARPGAGTNKKIVVDHKNQISFRPDKDLVESLKDIPNKNRYVNEIIRESLSPLEQQILNKLGEYLSTISFIEDYRELSEAEVQFTKACDLCYEILKRTELISSIKIERTEDMCDITESPCSVSKYPTSTNVLADEIIKNL